MLHRTKPKRIAPRVLVLEWHRLHVVTRQELGRLGPSIPDRMELNGMPLCAYSVVPQSDSSHGGPNHSSDSTPASSPVPSPAPEPWGAKADGAFSHQIPSARGRLRSLRRRWAAGGEAAPGTLPAAAVGNTLGAAAGAVPGQRCGRGADGRTGLGRRNSAAAAGTHLRLHLRRRPQVLLRRRAPALRPHRAPVSGACSLLLIRPRLHPCTRLAEHFLIILAGNIS